MKPAPFFAHRVIRAMTKVCATHEVGLDGLGFIAVIALQWDTIRYNRPVSYHISVLMNILDIKSKDSFYRIEKRCLASGWLKKRNQGTRKAVLYWVDIPERFGEIPDTPTEDGDDATAETRTNSRTNGHTNPGLITVPKPDSYPDLNRTHNSTPSSSSLSLIPVPVPVAVPGDETGGADPDPEPPKIEDRVLIRPLAPWVNWNRADPDDKADQIAELAGYVREHGAQVIMAAAQRGKAELGRKVYPNEIEGYLIARIEVVPQGQSETETRAKVLLAKLGLSRVEQLAKLKFSSEAEAIECLSLSREIADQVAQGAA